MDNKKWVQYGIYVVAFVGVIILLSLVVGGIKRLFKGNEEEESGYPLVFKGEYFNCKPA